MTTATKPRKFVPGTTGWTIDDLDDPHIERLWFAKRYEIVEGVLAHMPPAYFDGGVVLDELLYLLRTHVDANKLGGRFGREVDLILGQRRVPVVDAVYLSDKDLEAQRIAHAASGKRPRLKYGRILIPPTLIIESLSLGHESHDRETKRRWYGEARVPNYWLLDAQERSLECLVLDGADYRVDQSARDDAELRPSAFAGLVIPLAKVWAV